MFDVFMNIMLSVFSLYIVESYFSIYFAKSEKGIKVHMASLGYVVFQYFSDLLSLFSPVILFVLNIIVVTLVVRWKYKGLFSTQIMMSILLLIIWMISEVLVGYIFKYKGLSYEQVEVSGSVISKIIILIFVKIMKTKKNWAGQSVSLEVSIGLLCIPVSSIYIVHNIFALCSELESGFAFPFVSSIIILGMNCMVFIIYDKLALEEELYRNNLLSTQQLDFNERQMRERELSVQEFKRLRHDMKSHLFSIKAFLQNQQVEKAVLYIDNIANSGGLSSKDVCKSGHIIIDALINYRCSIAEEKDIKCNIVHQIPTELYFRNSDICVLLGNAFDNAIEAAEKVEISERYIELRMGYNKGCLLIEISNSYNGTIKMGNKGEFMTTKQDQKNHGIGMVSMKKVVDTYNGEMTINAENNIFEMTIMLYEREGERL